MRIEFITQDDSLYILPFFEEFLHFYSTEFEITQISACRAMGKRPRRKLLRELTCLYRPQGFLRLLVRVSLAQLLGLLPRSRKAAHFATLPQLCRTYAIPYARVGNPNHGEFMSAIRRRAPDLIVSVACPFILKGPLLSLPFFGCINIHHGPLPRYKGMMPTFWQMYHGEKKIGVCIHQMTANVDEGAALLRDELEIQPGETLDHLIRRSKRHGAHCMAEGIRQIASKTYKRFPLQNARGSYFTFPTLEEIREFHRRGFRAI